MSAKKSDEMTRLKKLLFNDYLNIPNDAFEVLKTDVIKLLKSYFDIKDGSYKLDILADGDGNFNISFSAVATHIKEVKILK